VSKKTTQRPTDDVRAAAAAMGRKGGAVTSARKTHAARKNGRLGGRRKPA
jgi:hypothetical protein